MQRWLEGEDCRLPAASTLKRDIDCLVRMYVATPRASRIPFEDTLDCPLAELGLIREFETGGRYALDRGNPGHLPDEMVTYALLASPKLKHTTARSIRIEELAYGPETPGQVFCLTEDALLPRLERLDSTTAGALSFDDTAGLRQVLVHSLPDPLDVLRAYYERRAPQHQKLAS